MVGRNYANLIIVNIWNLSRRWIKAYFRRYVV
nr:MAG TPA: hypothetical protein [Caudoviricetes sp.]